MEYNDRAYPTAIGSGLYSGTALNPAVKEEVLVNRLKSIENTLYSAISGLHGVDTKLFGGGEAKSSGTAPSPDSVVGIVRSIEALAAVVEQRVFAVSERL